MTNQAQDHAPIMEFDEITENIILGTSMCCEDHESYHSDKLAELDVYADIDLRAEHDDFHSTVPVHLKLNIMDTYPPTMEQMEIGVALIDQVANMGKKAYVHCQVAHGRSPTLVIAYLMLKQDMSFKDALEFVKSKRPEVHPTDRQLEFLQGLETAEK